MAGAGARTEAQVRADLIEERKRMAIAIVAGDANAERRHVSRVQELQRELRALDDTPVIPFRPSAPPGTPSGRPPVKA